ncbi:hypothetical protein [Brevibacillus borstelensis]|nr:hypothetical protein [Brevibacillus borstelensis]
MKKLLVMLAFTFVFTTTTMPSLLPDQKGPGVIANGAEPDW